MGGDASPIVLQPQNDMPGQLHGLALRLANTMEAAGVYRNCLTCRHFVEAMETCGEFNARPPARIIAYGCEKHSNEIPF